MIANNVYNNFASGELAPSVWGRTDRPFYSTGLEVCRNFIPLLTGGAFFRPGFSYIHHTRLNRVACLLTFRFNAAQSYTLEFTDLKMRVYKNGGVVTETAKNITNISQAALGVVTIGTHGFSTGDEVYISGVGGMTELNGNFYLVVKIDNDTFTLTTVEGTGVNTTTYGAYTSGGTAARIYEIATPYVEADLKQLKTAQTADLMYIVHPSYAPRKLTRAGHASWTLATYSRTADPFTGANKYPGAVGFFGGRLWMGGTNDDPDMFWGSKGPNATTGASQYDDFTVGTGALDSVVYTLTSQNLTVDRIIWFNTNPMYMVMGTTGGLYKANGGVDGAAITPTAVAVNPFSTFAVADLNPAKSGENLVYLQSNGRTLRSFEFDLLKDNYSAFDKNVLSENITYPYVTQIATSQGRPDLIWGVRSDGVLLTCTFLAQEDVAGWARHYIGGSGKVLSVASEPQSSAFDRVYICVERTINGTTHRYIEYGNEDPILPDPGDYYTAEDAEEADLQRWRNLMFEQQKTFNRLDGSVVLDTTQATTLTLSALTGTSVTATAGVASFTAADVGRYIFIKYLTGDETGVAKITAYTSTTEVTVQVLQDFSTLTVPTSGWYLLSSTVHGLHHWEGETIQVVTDGGVHPDVTVLNGSVTLDYAARYIILGKKYMGYLRTLDLEFGSAKSGFTQGLMKNMIGLYLKLKDTLGGSYGSTLHGLYDVAEMLFRNSTTDLYDRPPVLFSGLKEVTNFDTWAQEKRLHLVQDQPLPMTVLSYSPMLDIGA